MWTDAASPSRPAEQRGPAWPLTIARNRLDRHPRRLTRNGAAHVHVSATQGLCTLGDLIARLVSRDYQVRQFRSVQHRSRPDRPSRRLPVAAPRGNVRAHHAPDPPVSQLRPARRRGGHRHHQGAQTSAPPPYVHARRPLGLASIRVPGFPDRLRENPPRQELLRAPRIPRRPRPPPSPVAGHPRSRLLLRVAQE